MKKKKNDVTEKDIARAMKAFGVQVAAQVAERKARGIIPSCVRVPQSAERQAEVLSKLQEEIERSRPLRLKYGKV